MQQALKCIERCNAHGWILADYEDEVYAAITALKAALEQPEQEPVACRFCHDKKGCWTWQCYSCGEIDDVQKPAPPAAQRPWQGLTAEEILDLFDSSNVYGSKWIEFARTVEAKLKEKNDH